MNGDATMTSPDATPCPPSDWDAGYEMGCRHGYERATAELLRILQERMKGGEDILPLLPLVDELRGREYRALGTGLPGSATATDRR